LLTERFSVYVLDSSGMAIRLAQFDEEETREIERLLGSIGVSPYGNTTSAVRRT
jgi:hypothetical protein